MQVSNRFIYLQSQNFKNYIQNVYYVAFKAISCLNRNISFIFMARKSTLAFVYFINSGLFKYYANILNYRALHKTSGE